ncbi:Nif3-like dinuclear metal center hexameric protein [Furfurilactobacillus entadae]|uniref:Nif3-like dinuclear metal center hexameric protein n=1 Tax=Furfurilactobacillus entadae TaxID=2922307 RepID=UPI0038B3FFD9
MMQAQTLIDQFETFAPLSYREAGDPTGFQIGDRHAEIHRVMTTLDVRPEVVDEAIAQNVDFIFAHHPVMFRPAKNLDFAADPQLAMYGKLVANHITVYAAHTNLDNAPGGMNDWLAETLGLTAVSGWLPNPEAPTVQMGRVGALPESMSMQAFAEYCKTQFKVGGLRLISHEPDRLVSRVAVLGGDGGKFFHEAQATGADVYVTGDVYYHTGHDMLAANFSVVDPGHHIEAVCIPKLAAMLRQWSVEKQWHIDVVESKPNTDPFIFV